MNDYIMIKIGFNIYSSLLIMEARVHKLLILVGEEGQEFEARDFKKLNQVIVNEYLQENNAEIKGYLIEFMPKVIRGVPLKAHFYAALTAVISRQNLEVSAKIIEAVLQHLQTDLNACKYSQALNSINYLSQAMNISLFNSLTLMNLFEDILISIEKESDNILKKGLIQILIKALPLCACSLHQKIYHQFKKFIEKLRKISDGEQISEYIYLQFTKNNIKDYSGIVRLQIDLTGLEQIQSKFKLHIDLKTMRNREYLANESYRWENSDANPKYLQYKRTQGSIIRSHIQLLIDVFDKNAPMLILKLNNLIRAHSEEYFFKNFVEALALRGLKAKNSIVYFSLLVSLKNSLASQQFNKVLQQTLFELFQSAEDFQLSVLITYAKLFSFILNNWKGDFDWSRFLQGQEGFVKRNALLKLILQKLTLQNDKFVTPPALQSYQPNKPVVSEQEYTATEDMEIYEEFQGLLKSKTQAEGVVKLIDSEKKYQIFLQALFRRTSQSQTHLNILQGRYHDILVKFQEWDWDLINKIRNFFKNSFFHRLLYLRFMIQRKALAFASYINYVGELKNKSQIQMIWIKMELNELNSQFGKTLRQKS